MHKGEENRTKVNRTKEIHEDEEVHERGENRTEEVHKNEEIREESRAEESHENDEIGRESGEEAIDGLLRETREESDSVILHTATAASPAMN